jgi:uncharacterized membrane protein
MFDAKWKSGFFLLFTLFLQVTFDFTMLFEVPVARQVIGLLFLTFVPGFIVVKLLKFDKFDFFEIVLFSAGFSIVFLMIAGFATNELFMFGVSHPLSVVPFMIVLNCFTLVGGVLVYLQSEGVKIQGSEPFKLSPFALLFLFLPILSIVGAMYVNAYQNNLLLLFMIIAISLLFVVGVMSKKLLPSNLYPFALLMIAIAVLYSSSLISNYIVPFGSDVPVEYFLFKTTAYNAHWSSTLPFLSNNLSPLGADYARENTMLAITILPTVYSTLLKMDSTWMFKLLFPLIFALVPLGLYQIWQKYVGKKYAFISAFLFIAQETFFTEMLGLNRQIIAELFFVLLLFVILNEKIKPVNKMICFALFSFGLVTSHYAVALIFLFFISCTVVSLIVLKRPSKKLTVSMVVLFFAVMFIWYIYTSGSATFNSFLQFGNTVYGHLSDFFNPTSRGQTVLTGVGLAQSPSIWNTISRMFAYLTEGLIIVGFIGFVSARARRRIRIDEYFILSFAAMVLLAMVILIPDLANTLDMTRFYHILLFFLAPLCVMGAVFIVRLFSKREKELAVCALLLIVLVPFFLFQTEFVYEVTGSESWSISLSGYRMNPLELYGHEGYTDAYSVYGAQWLSRNIDVKDSTLYADDSPASAVLMMYGMVYIGDVNGLSNTTKVATNGVIYLNTLNVVDGVIPSGQLSLNSSKLSFIFNDLDLVYSNGGSEIYKNSP